MRSTKVEGLRVTSRTSAFAFKGKDVDVRRDRRAAQRRARCSRAACGGPASRLRVTAQLINVADGYHLWSETYDRQLADVFAAAGRAVAVRSSKTLRPKLVGAASGPLVVAATTSLEAYTLYLQGRFFWNKRTLEGHRRGIGFFEQALALDPGYALAYTGLADCWSMLAFDYVGGTPPREGMPKAKVAAERALALDDTLAEAHSPLAVVEMLYDWDWPGPSARSGGRSS